MGLLDQISSYKRGIMCHILKQEVFWDQNYGKLKSPYLRFKYKNVLVNSRPGTLKCVLRVVDSVKIHVFVSLLSQRHCQRSVAIC